MLIIESFLNTVKKRFVFFLLPVFIIFAIKLQFFKQLKKRLFSKDSCLQIVLKYQLVHSPHLVIFSHIVFSPSFSFAKYLNMVIKKQNKT